MKNRMMKTTVFALLAACGAVSGIATAQELTPFPPGMPIRHLMWDGNDYFEVPSGYSDRAPTVYDSDTAAACLAYLGTANVLDDVSFGPIGPWANTTNNAMRTITVPVANSLTAVTSFDLRVSIWDTANFGASPMVATTATPLWQGTFPINNLANGAYYLTITPATPVTLPDNQVYVQLQFFTRNTTTQVSIAAGQPARTFAANLITVGPGSSTDNWGLDRANNGILEGGAVGTTDRQRTAFTAGTCINQAINLPLIITGDVPVTPPSFVSLGSLGNTLNRTEAFTAGQVKWFQFTLPGDVSDAARTFLDITTLNSTIANTTLALYTAGGNVIWSDENSGPDDLAQLSFGIGRRAADGNGDQKDGYDGELLGTDTFYLAVAEGGTRFGDGFIVTPVTPGTAGNIQLQFRSNVAGGGLSPSVAPAGTDLGVLLSPGAPGTSVLPGLKQILWTTFNVCKDINGATEDNYLDIDFSNCDPTGDADQEAFIFNSLGNLVGYDDDSGPGFFPQFSYGHPGPRGPYVTGGEPFTGINGGLGAGTYYMGVGHLDVRELANADTDGRWHIRPLGGDNLNIQSDFYVGYFDCNASCSACPADYNQSGGVDGSDVESFFTDWAQSLPCADTNLDGSVDGSDVEAFFVPWQNGGC